MLRRQGSRIKPRSQIFETKTKRGPCSALSSDPLFALRFLSAELLNETTIAAVIQIDFEYNKDPTELPLLAKIIHPSLATELFHHQSQPDTERRREDGD